MTNNHVLIPGTVKAIFEKETDHPGYERPWLQVISIRKLNVTKADENGASAGNQPQPPSNLPDRYRVLLADGEHLIQAMFGSSFATMIAKEVIRKCSIIRIISYALNQLNKKSPGVSTYVLIPKEIELNSIEYPDDIIGNPTHYGAEATAAAAVNNPGMGNEAPAPNNPQPEVNNNNVVSPNNRAVEANSKPINPYNSAPSGAINLGYNATHGNGANSSVQPPQSANFSGNQSYNSSSSFNNNNNSNFNNNISKSSNFGEMKNEKGKAVAASSSSVDESLIVPIDALSPYNSRWMIKARVTNKSDIRTWSNQRGEGKLFSVTLVDSSGEIKATAFNDAVDRLFGVLHLNKVYYVSKASVKISRKQFSNVQNDYEISFDNHSVVEPCLDDESQSSVPTIRFRFCPIGDINGVEKDQTVDVLGVVKTFAPVAEFVSKTNQRVLKKRELNLVDSSGFSVALTLWGNEATSFDESTPNQIIAIKGARVGDYQGKNLSAMSSSTITFNPDIAEAHELRGWFDHGGADYTFTPLGMSGSGVGSGAGITERIDRRYVISQIVEEGLGCGEKADFFTIYATIHTIRSEGNIYYTACPSPNCNKKVTEHNNGQWKCEKCSKIYSHCDYRYTLNVSVFDHSGGVYLNCFDDVGRTILGISAEDIHHMRENGDTANFDAVFKNACFQTFIFKVKAKQEMYQNESKLRCSAVSITLPDYERECDQIIEELKQCGFNDL